MDKISTKTVVQIDEVMSLILESLESGSSVRFSPSGVSMMPMLRQGIDSVILSPVFEPLKKFDLVLYLRDNGKYVLHRIVETGDTYVCMGDNQYIKETGVRPDQIKAVVTAFYRGETLYRISNPVYRIYCRTWYGIRHARILYREMKLKLRRFFSIM